MKRVLVIADDLSGAAEIAGIGQRYGLSTRIRRERTRQAAAELTVVDTDSRSLDPQSAGMTAEKKVRDLRRQDFELIFKKTDSALRGPIAAEVEALRDHFQFSAAMLLAQNPSRGRTIENGQYCINGVPLDQTPFADDPEHPARTSQAADLLGSSSISICDARNAEEVSQWAARTRRDVLPAGGADFFEAILRDRGLTPTRAFEQQLPPGPTLFVCGSASAYSRELIALARSQGVLINPENWKPAQSPRALLTIDRPIDRAPGAAGKWEDFLADAAQKILRRKARIASVMLEGGSTASAVCRCMGWNDLEVCGELAVGVVHLRAHAYEGSQDLYIKPGSYPWPDAVWKEN